MILLSNLLQAVSGVLYMILNLVLILVVVRCVMSWLSPDPYNPLVQFIFRATEPIMRPVRKIIPPLGGGLDLSPLVIAIVVYFVQVTVCGTLNEYAFSLKAAR